MPAVAGRTIGLYWNGVLVAGVREKGITCNGEAIDSTNDDSAGWRTLIDAASVNGVDVPVSGVLINDRLKADWFSGASAVNTRMRTLELRYPDGGIVSGTFYITEYTETGPHDDAMTFEASFMSSGVVTYSPI